MDNHKSDNIKYPMLNRINSPADLRALPASSLPEVCAELRQFIIDNLSTNPGHFASSMGAVEIAVALHYVFDTPADHLVWDVGHQAYAHKILTGRKATFGTLRKKDGLSGFPSPLVSEYDTFMAGHASNSISAALGMAVADSLTPGHENRHTVAVIGDASISGGLAFEGLNNASNNKNNLLIILNDNDMSIDDNVGALHRYLTKLTTSPGYNRWRYNAYNFLKERGLFNESRRSKVLRFNNSIKSLISNHQNIFEGLNIRYFGPFDGHDVDQIVKVLSDIKDMKGPRILHLRTVKGKGFMQAEKDPATWHAPGKFNPSTGERSVKKNDKEPLLWQQVFGNTLVELADRHPNVVGVTAAMPSGTSMSLMMAKYPDRSFDVGISEGHAVTFAGGMASQGMKPFVAIYSSFLQRAYDSIIHDVAIQNLPVTFCLDRAGIVGEDGVTHHGLFDLAYLRLIPGMYIASPMDETTLRNLMYTSLDLKHPFAIRYPRGKALTPDWKTEFSTLTPGRARILNEGTDGCSAVLTLGPVGNDAADAISQLAEKGIQAAHYDMVWLKPMDTDLLKRITERHPVLITVEDGTVEGGFGSAVADYIVEHSLPNKVIKLGVPDRWVHQGTVSELRHDCGYDTAAIMQTIEDASSKLSKK